MGLLLQAVVEGGQLDADVAALEGEPQDVIGESGVLGEEGTVQVGAEGVSVDGTLKPRLLTAVARNPRGD